MDIQRLKKLTGQAPSLVEQWKEVNLKKQNETKQSKKKVADNNKTPKNASAEDVSTDKHEIAAELVAVDNKATTAKAGKKDAAGQKAKAKTEKLHHTVSIGDNGAPNVDDNTTLDVVDVETWGEGYVVASADNVYVTEYETSLVGSTDLEQAVVFKTLEDATVVANMFETVEIRKVKSAVASLFEMANNSDDFLAESVELVGVKVTVRGNEKDVATKLEAFLSGLGCACEIHSTDQVGRNAVIKVKCSETEDFKELCDKIHDGFTEFDILDCVPIHNLGESAQLDMILSEGMRDEINDRIRAGKVTQFSIIIDGETLTGHIDQANQSVVHVSLTDKSLERHGGLTKNIVIPVDVETLKWSDEHPNRVIGVSKNTGFRREPKEEPARMPTVKPGKTDDASTWALDMSSEDAPKGKPLAEYVREVKTTKR